jgi:hypothetical protein
MRATTATNALDNGADIAKVQEWLGHANIATTRIYDHRSTWPKDSPTFKVSYRSNLEQLFSGGSSPSEWVCICPIPNCPPANPPATRGKKTNYSYKQTNKQRFSPRSRDLTFMGS